jgi:type I restriction enzyme, S subunit
MAIENLITEHIDIWTSAIQSKSSSGRGSSKKIDLYGIKKLRELILELAVRGKLVPQDPNDEPASVLFERIETEKAQLVNDGKLKKQKKLPPVGDKETPYELPKGWKWARLGNVTSASTGFAFKTAQYEEHGTFVLRVTNINLDGSINKEDNKYISPQLANTEFGNYQLAKDDILLVMVGGSLGKLGVVTEEVLPAVLNQNMWKLSRFALMPVGYFLCGLTHINRTQINITASTHGHLAQGDYMDKLFPVPPLAEQHRIVAKVDELMALCDQLEQQTEASIEAHQVLVEALLATLTNSADADELMENWQRISTHFDTLFTTEASIDQLKQTILQLAVMGKLSKPLDSDTPVSNHLDSILEQQKLTASAKEFKLIEAELANAKVEVDANRVMLKARCFCDFITKGTTPSKTELLEIGDVPFLKVYNIVDNQLDFDYRPIFISQGVHEGKLKRSMASPGDVIMNIVGPPLGKVTVLTDQYTQWNMNQALAVFKPVDVVFNRYLYYVLSCDLTLNSVLKEVKGTAGQDNLSLEQCRDLLIPVIGIEEQKRLVELVDILLDQCKFLKTRLEESQTTQLYLTDAIVEQLV